MESALKHSKLIPIDCPTRLHTSVTSERRSSHLSRGSKGQARKHLTEPRLFLSRVGVGVLYMSFGQIEVPINNHPLIFKVLLAKITGGNATLATHRDIREFRLPISVRVNCMVMPIFHSTASFQRAKDSQLGSYLLKMEGWNYNFFHFPSGHFLHKS